MKNKRKVIIHGKDAEEFVNRYNDAKKAKHIFFTVYGKQFRTDYGGYLIEHLQGEGLICGEMDENGLFQIKNC